MKDTRLYQQILGLQSPWKVESVELKREAGEIEVRVRCEQTRWMSESGERLHVHGYEERRWRHLDSCQFRTFLVAKVPRLKYPDGRTELVRVPWAEKNSRFTMLFERLAIDLLQQCSVKAACEILRIGWDASDGIKQRAVRRGLRRRQIGAFKRLCVDEKSYGSGHQYLTLVAQIHADRSATVAYIGEGREEATLQAFWSGLSEPQKRDVEAVAMDMWKPYINATKAQLYGASEKIVHDPFHLHRYMNEAVNTVRKQEHAMLQKRGDQRLKGTRYYWLYAQENRPDRVMDSWDGLKVENLKTARAWAIKEMFRSLWKCASEDEARRFFSNWYGWATRSRLAPVKRVARMLKKHLPQILSFFRHRLTNAAIEGLNNKIQAIVKKAYGHRNLQRFKNDIFFHLGGLQLHPGRLSHGKT